MFKFIKIVAICSMLFTTSAFADGWGHHHHHHGYRYGYNPYYVPPVVIGYYPPQQYYAPPPVPYGGYGYPVGPVISVPFFVGGWGHGGYGHHGHHH